MDTQVEQTVTGGGGVPFQGHKVEDWAKEHEIELEAPSPLKPESSLGSRKENGMKATD